MILCNCYYFSAKLSEISQIEPSEAYKRVLRGDNNGDRSFEQSPLLFR